jgi:hypothetical protein
MWLNRALVITKWGCAGSTQIRTLPMLLDQGTTRTAGNLNTADVRLLLGKWMEEQTSLLCLGSFNECRLVLKAHVFSISEEAFTLRSLSADTTLSFSFGSNGTVFDYAEQREFGMPELPPKLAQLASIAIMLPTRTAVNPLTESTERETLIMIEMWEGDRENWSEEK